MFKPKFFTQSLSLILLTFTFLSSANAVLWTAGEIATSLEEARLSGTAAPFDTLLAAKIKEELDLAGVKVLGGSFQYTQNVKGINKNINTILNQSISITDDVDIASKDLLTILTGNSLISNTAGKCEVPLPGSSLINFLSDPFSVRAFFDPVNTNFNFNLMPDTTSTDEKGTGKIIINASLDTSLDVDPIAIGLEWGGVYPVPEAYCALTGFFGECIFWDVRYTWKCQQWKDRIYGYATGNVKANFALELKYSYLQPSASNNGAITINTPTLTGELTQSPVIAIGGSNPDLSPTHTPTQPALDLLAHSFNGLYQFYKISTDGATADFDTLIKDEQARINTEFSPVSIELPSYDPDSQLVKDINSFLIENKIIENDLNLEISVVSAFIANIVETRWSEILYYVLTDNQNALIQLFAVEALCPLAEELKTIMPTTLIYAIDSSNTCIVADPSGIDYGNYFSDASCLASIEFQPENFQAFCQEAFTAAPNPLLGNPKSWASLGYKNDLTQSDISTKWTLASGSQLQTGSESLKGVNAPFVKRIRFRDVGNCALEMRVYKKDITATNLKPLIFFHGGSWTLRGGGYVGAEALLSHYTDAGFAVFTPFYRMSSTGDGPVECQETPWNEITADSEAALKWVQDFGGQFGADTTRIAVAGQSSGAHLAGWLVTKKSKEVDRALLIYPPTDVYDFINRHQQKTFGNLANGMPYNPQNALGTASALYDVDTVTIENTDLLNPPLYVTENSYAEIVKAAPTSYPPVFLMHGMNDSLLDASQSVALCNAYGGTAVEDGGGPVNLRAVYECGKNSVMHLFQEGEHAFDLCPFPTLDGGCFAGSPASEALIVNSMQAAREWLLLDCKNLKQKCK